MISRIQLIYPPVLYNKLPDEYFIFLKTAEIFEEQKIFYHTSARNIWQDRRGEGRGGLAV